MLEKMSDFFEKRLDGYDEHMMNNIEAASEFYPFTAMQLPTQPKACILDLGCGTGLELEEYISINPTARITGIDLSRGMLEALRKKLPNSDITLICGSYFELPLGVCAFDGAVSVESLHHFTKEEKIGLYTRLREALRDGGYFILTDYFALSEDEELMHRQRLADMKLEQGITDGELYHYDTPLSVNNELDALYRAGFSSAEVIGCWGATHTIKAKK